MKSRIWTRTVAGFYRMHGPTWLVATTIYGSWLLLTVAHHWIPLPLLFVLGGTVIAWHGSLQHETIHGHPAGPRWVGAVLGAPALSLWLPYAIYRDSHRRHHATHQLTDPAHDPEAPHRLMPRTLLGRLVFGPWVTVGTFLFGEAVAIGRAVPGRRRAWLSHMVSSAIVLAWLIGVAHMPIWKYLLLFVYPGASLTLLRSFSEHRRDSSPERRTAVIEAGLFFRLVFLNNNYHVAHHKAPRAPWFELPRLWASRRATFAARAPDLIHAGYLPLARTHLLRAPDEGRS